MTEGEKEGEVGERERKRGGGRRKEGTGDEQRTVTGFVRCTFACVHASCVRTHAYLHTGTDEIQRSTYIELRYPQNCLRTVGSGYRYASYLTCTDCPEIIIWLEGSNFGCKATIAIIHEC